MPGSARKQPWSRRAHLTAGMMTGHRPSGVPSRVKAPPQSHWGPPADSSVKKGPPRCLERMGNKNTSGPSKGLDAGSHETHEGEQPSETGITGPYESVGGPSPELMASLQTLVEAPDYTLLPQSLHQMAEAYSLKDDYQWAIQFLQLEKSYHERLLSNLAALQETWERQLEGQKDPEGTESNSSSDRYMETLEQLCRNHSSIMVLIQKEVESMLIQEEGEEEEEEGEEEEERRGGEEEEVEDEEERRDGEEEEEGEGEEEERRGGDEEEEEVCEEGQEVEEDEEVCEETTPEEEEVNGEWPTGVPQASEKDLVKLSHAEGGSAPDGLVSILKRRRASLDGLPPPGVSVEKHNGKRKVRFTEPEDAAEQDEVGGDSCLILLLLCLVTVVISIGGTALYCTLVDTYSNICTDFSHNVNFYVVNVRRVFDQLKHWLPIQT
ncbi:unnamed protein product [Merluccius merluccius]